MTGLKAEVEIFTDGACRGNPGPGGWGVLIRFGDVEKQIWGNESNTTNNRMELLAAIKGLEALTRSCTVSITTDSQYVRQGITSWISSWKANQWKNSHKKPVKNRDLWERLDALSGKHNIAWHWVKGHSGHKENELADSLANRGIDELGGL